MCKIVLSQTSGGGDIRADKSIYDVEQGGYFTIEFGAVEFTVAFEDGLIGASKYLIKQGEIGFRVSSHAVKGKEYICDFNEFQLSAMDMAPRVKIKVRP